MVYDVMWLVRRQTIIWTSALTSRTDFSEVSIKIQTFSVMKVHWNVVCRVETFGSRPRRLNWFAYRVPLNSDELSSSLQWRHNGRNGVSNHQPHDCLLNRLFNRRSKKTLKLRVTGLCAGNSPAAGEFPAQMASNAENVPIWWRHHVIMWLYV